MILIIENEPGFCWVCGAPCPETRVTCSDDCHEKLIQILENDFGVYKKVVNMETGKTHKVPTRDIIERGLEQKDLKKYPKWGDNEESKFNPGG